MGAYRLYYFHAAALAGADEIEAADDDEALRIARERAAGHSVEIWRGHDKVGTIAPAGVVAG